MPIYIIILMPKVKKKKSDYQSKTLCCFDPFNKFDKRIIDFMSHISKNIYNTAIYCHQIYDIFYVDIYTDLFDSLNENFSNKLETEIVHDLLFKIFNVYHSFYSNNKSTVDFINNFIQKTVFEINKKNPIINTNFMSVINSVFMQIVKEIQKTSVMCHKYFNLIQRRVYDEVSWKYNENFTITKNEILSKKKCTINNKDFIDDIKNGFINLSTILDRSSYKKKISDEFKIDIKSDQFIIKKFTVNNLGNNLNLIPSDVTTNIIDRTFDCYKSFLALKEKGIKSNGARGIVL